MKTCCVYCGSTEAIERDHVPPKCFFPEPRPSELITVPSCTRCNRGFGKDDERVRNILTSLSTTEIHPAVVSQLAAKRDRSFNRREGAATLKHFTESLKVVDIESSGGTRVGPAYAIDLDQDAINRFMDRMTRALMYHANGIGWVDCKIDWKMPPKDERLAELSRKHKWLLAPRNCVSIGGDVFSYLGYFLPNSAASLCGTCQ
jgi:hypothetical protein